MNLIGFKILKIGDPFARKGYGIFIDVSNYVLEKILEIFLNNDNYRIIEVLRNSDNLKIILDNKYRLVNGGFIDVIDFRLNEVDSNYYLRIISDSNYMYELYQIECEKNIEKNSSIELSIIELIDNKILDFKNSLLKDIKEILKK